MSPSATIPAVSDPDDNRPRAVRRLLQRLRDIPEGEIAKTARGAGMAPRQLRSLRSGKSADVKISTLERLAAGLREPLGWILDAGPRPAPAVSEEPPAVDVRAVRRLLRRLDAVAEAARQVAEQLPDDEAE